MDKVTVSSIADSKPSMVVSVEAAGAITVGAGELVIAMGTNVRDTNNQRCVTALDALRDRLKEANYPVGQVTISSGEPPNLEAFAVTDAAAIPALTEDDAVIAYDAAFYNAGNSTNIGAIITRAIEVYQEQILKFS